MLPSKTRLVSFVASVLAVLSVLVGGFVALAAGLGAPVDGAVQPRLVAEAVAGLSLVVFGCLVFWVAARRDISPRTEDEESHSKGSSEMLWPW